MDIGTTETLTVNALGGDDAFTVGPGLARADRASIDGGAGVDTFARRPRAGRTSIGGTEIDTLNFDARTSR